MFRLGGARYALVLMAAVCGNALIAAEKATKTETYESSGSVTLENATPEEMKAAAKKLEAELMQKVPQGAVRVASTETSMQNTFQLKSLDWTVPPEGKNPLHITGDLELSVKTVEEGDSSGFLPDSCWYPLQAYLLDLNDNLRKDTVAHLSTLPREKLLAPSAPEAIAVFVKQYVLNHLTKEAKQKAEFPALPANVLDAALQKSLTVTMRNYRAAP